MEPLTFEAKEGLLRGDDLVPESMGELKENVLKWEQCMEAKGLKVITS